MKLFVDTADINQIRNLAETGLLSGVTTNPSLIFRTGRPFEATLKEICALVEGPVSAEVVATSCPEMLKEARKLGEISENIMIKLPITWEGLKACKILAKEGYAVNMTLCFSALQGLLCAEAGARFVSVFIGRSEDAGLDGMALFREVQTVCIRHSASQTETLAASIRSTDHVRHVALAGAHAATLPPQIFFQLAQHPLTDKGLELFLEDWRKTGQSIL